MFKKLYDFIFNRYPDEEAQQIHAVPATSMSILEAAIRRDEPVEETAVQRRNRIADTIEDFVYRVRPGKGMVAVTPEGKAAMDSINGGGGNIKGQFNLAGSMPVPEAQLMWYASQTFPGFQTLALIAQHWLVMKAISMPPEDAVRNGWQLRVGADELTADQLAFIEDLDDQFDTKNNVERHAVFTRLFGIRITMYLFDVPDPAEFYKLPFNPDAIQPGSYRGMSQVDPYWCAPELNAQASGDPSAQDFYVPTWWVINGMRVHRSHLCIGLGDEVADVLKPSYLFSGVSVTQKIFDRVYASERTANEAPALAMAKRMRTLSTNAAKAIAKQGELEAALEWRARTMSNFGTDVIDKNSDKIEYWDTSLADLDTVIMTEYQIVAAIAGAPATKILGTSPKGFQSTGEFESKSYEETKRTIQNKNMTPVLKGHYLRLMRSHIVPKFPDLAGRHLVAVWNPTDVPTASEQADINLKKAQTDQINVDVGAIDGPDVRNRLIADKTSGYGNLQPLDSIIEDALNGDDGDSI